MSGRGIGGTLGKRGGRGIGGAGGSSEHHHHGLARRLVGGGAKLVTNLGSDVKDAVEGLPAGAVVTAKALAHDATHDTNSSLIDLIRGKKDTSHFNREVAKPMARATWNDWSPLFKGHPVQFAKQTYEHPLAPLLDVATVFSAGAGAAAKLGKAAEAAGMEGRLVKGAAELGKPGHRMVRDTKAVTEERAPRPDLVKAHGDAAGANLRRKLANRALLHSEPYLPAWFKQTAREGRLYSRLHHSDIAHRSAATNLQINALMRAGKAVADPELQHIIQPELLSHNYWNLRRYAHEVDASKPLPAGYRYVKELTDPREMFAAREGVALESRMRSFGKDFTSSKIENAAKLKGGKRTLIVPLHDARNLALEGENSTRFLRKLAHSPVMLWKRVNVGYVPRVITNNAVGNWAMHAMRTGGEGGGRGFLDAVKYAHGNRAAMKAFKEMRSHIAETQGAEAGAKFTALAHPSITADPNLASIEKTFGKRAADAVKRPPDWQRQFFSDELGNVFGNVLKEGEEKGGKLRKIGREGFYPIVHRVADEPVRVAALYQFMRKSPEVRSYLKTHPGVKLDNAIQAVLKRNPAKLRERAVQHVRSIAGDYTTMGPGERLVQNIVPFYLWDKHIVKHFGNMVSEKPGRIVAMQQTSRMGKDETEKLLGAIPNFMEGAIPLSLFGMEEHNGRTPILSTSGLNPYATIGELADTATGLTTRHDETSGSESASELSPILTGLIEQIGGHKIGSNAPAETHGGVIPSVLADTALSTSYGTLARRLIEGTPKPKVDANGNSKPFLYEKTPGESLLGLIGFPKKNVDLERAHDMADAQSGHKKKKKRGIQYAAGR